MANIDGSNRVVFNLQPPKSSEEQGLCYQIYSNRLSQLIGIPVEKVVSILPPGAEPWIYYPTAGDDYKGFTGFFSDSNQIDKFLRALKNE